MYKTVLIEGITTENVTDKIDKQIVEMEKQSYRLITMSFLGTEKAVLVFKKGLKGSLLHRRGYLRRLRRPDRHHVAGRPDLHRR